MKKEKVDEFGGKANQLFISLSQALVAMDAMQEALEKVAEDQQRTYLSRGGDNQLGQLLPQLDPKMDEIGESMRNAKSFLQYDVKYFLDRMYTVAQGKKWRQEGEKS